MTFVGQRAADSPDACPSLSPRGDEGGNGRVSRDSARSVAEVLEGLAADAEDYRAYVMRQNQRAPRGSAEVNVAPLFRLPRALRQLAEVCRARQTGLPSSREVPLTEWASANGVRPRTARDRAERGRIPGARRRGDRWVVLEEVPGTADLALGPPTQDDLGEPQ